MLSVMNHL